MEKFLARLQRAANGETGFYMSNTEVCLVLESIKRLIADNEELRHEQVSKQTK